MTTEAAGALQAFEWRPQPEAQRLVRALVDDFLGRCSAARRLAERMREETGTRFFDWIDSVMLPGSDELRQRLGAAGFVKDYGRQGEYTSIYAHPGAIFPRIALGEGENEGVMIRVESVADFLTANPMREVTLRGDAMSPVRRLLLAREERSELWAVERHGDRGYAIPPVDSVRALLFARHLEALRTRYRDFEQDEEGFEHAEQLISAAVEQLGTDLACDLFFAAEREYWQRRNRAAQFQKARQDRLGLGWANHDHHTYRSSRRHFSRLIGIFERLGFDCRERFYAGREAGWGAQVLDQRYAGIVVFADVDLAPEEVRNDFAHEPMQERQELGTVGLWCALHGESFLQAGMHHLECQFDFEALKAQMESEGGFKVMPPFTNYPHLRQAFTEGERWPVKEERIALLLEQGKITHEQARQFRENGAIGSHLENLERNEGFKGFDQKGVSEIIAATDPRRQSGE